MHSDRIAVAPSIPPTKPLARSEDLIVEQLDEELLVYDQRNDLAHCLGVTAARVWRACDGGTAPDELSAALDLEPEVVARALDELGDWQLLDAGGAPDGGPTRRELTVKVAKVGATAALVAPLMATIAAPAAAQSASEIARCAAIELPDVGGCGNTCHANCCCCCDPDGPVKFCAPAVRCPGDDFCLQEFDANCTGGGTGGDCPDAGPC